MATKKKAAPKKPAAKRAPAKVTRDEVQVDEKVFIARDTLVVGKTDEDGKNIGTEPIESGTEVSPDDVGGEETFERLVASGAIVNKPVAA